MYQGALQEPKDVTSSGRPTVLRHPALTCQEAFQRLDTEEVRSAEFGPPNSPRRIVLECWVFGHSVEIPLCP